MNITSSIEEYTKYFESKGYHSYDPTPFDRGDIIERFQKRFDDERGTKYFIDIIVWDHGFVPKDRRDGWWTPYGFEFETQWYSKDKHDAVDFTFHTSWTLEEVEEYLEKMFETGLFDYYEED